jgi:FkbM family methyltransferase
MSNYWDKNFLQNINNIDNIKYVCEVGARYGDESIMLSNIFKNAKILSFECNPNTINICKKKLMDYQNIKFFDNGLGSIETEAPFFSYNNDNDGASSFLKRIDFDKTQKENGYIKIKTLSTILINENIPYINILCMDVQGYELNVLQGCADYLSKIEYIIMEEPKQIINTEYLPANIFSKYINAPSSNDIKNFMNRNNFIEIERIEENNIEDNVMYKNICFTPS